MGMWRRWVSINSIGALPRSALSLMAFIILLIMLIVVIAILQYRWSGQVSEAEHERMHASLLTAMNQFRLQFNSEIQQLGILLRPAPDILVGKNWDAYAQNCSSALHESDNHLIREVYLWVAGDAGDSQLMHLNRTLRQFESLPWPSNLAPVRARYAASFNKKLLGPPDIPSFAWKIMYRVPLLIEPIVVFRQPSNGPEEGIRLIGYLMIELNWESLRLDILPELARRTFHGPNGFIYHVAVVSGTQPNSIIFRSDPQLTIDDISSADARIRLIEFPRERFGPGIPGNRVGPPELGPPRPPMMPATQNFPLRGMAPIMVDDGDDNWELVAKHREGSLERAVTGLRRRNLAISFGSLLLLALSMAFVITSARRSQHLARLQLEFVAGVSHELRTPLAVICSASDNLAEGIIADSSQSARTYGTLIRSEGRKLTGMIEQILQFAGIRSGRRGYNLVPVQINDIAELALQQAQSIIAASGISVEKTFVHGLPQIHADPAALLQTILNLIQNASKYSGDSRWIAIRTGQIHQKGKLEIQLSVEDKGIGIAKNDLPHIFDPFYRGGEAAISQIHGAGLGLFIVRESLKAMGAAISVKSAPGKGSTFTMHFRALPKSIQTEDANQHGV
jgi:signal transduction histidine kinase